MNLCHYCARDGHPKVPECKTVHAPFVAHDARGCLYVCGAHALWRETTSRAGGHKDCPLARPDGPLPLSATHVELAS